MPRIINIILINLLIIIGLSEIVLRLSWKNPYLTPEEQAYIHHPNTRLTFHRVSDLYEGAEDPIRFNTTSLGYILAPRTEDLKNSLDGTYDIAIGGSTTETALVQEGKRWPDLLDKPTLNYGRSRMNSVHSFFNIRYVLETQKLRPRHIFVLGGINDLSLYLKRGPGAFETEGFQDIVSSPWIDKIVKNFYLPAFLWRFSKQYNYLHFYLYEAAKSSGLPVISDQDFSEYLRQNGPVMNSVLADVYGKMAAEAEKHGASLIVLTQPHAFRGNYRPYHGNDLRVFPVIHGQRTNKAQAEELMDRFNDITLEVAKSLHLHTIDTAACFRQVDVSALLYDTVHFTEQGSLFLANCIRQRMP